MMTRLRAAIAELGEQLDERTVTGLVGLAALAAGVTVNWGPGWTLTVVGALVLAIAVGPALLALLGGRYPQ